MVENLYIIQCKNGLYADLFFYDDPIPQRVHDQIRKRIKEKCPSFNFPYLALFPGPLTVVLESPGNYNLCGISHLGESLDEYIGHLHNGDDKSYVNGNVPITAVVEFSSEELYPEVIKKLAQKYALHHISIE